MEFHVGAIPRINCVQSSGTPSASALTASSTSKQIARLRKIDISSYKEVILDIAPVVFTSMATALGDSCLSARTNLSPTCIAYENIILTRRHNGHFGVSRDFYVRPNSKH